MSRLPLATNTRFVSTLTRTLWNQPVFGEESWERIGLLEHGTVLLKVTWRKGEIISRNNPWTFFTDCPFTLISINYLDSMWTILIEKNETFIETKTTMENLWQRTIQLSDFFFNIHWCSFPNGSVWLEVAESVSERVVLLQQLSIHDGTVAMRGLGIMLLWVRLGIVVWISSFDRQLLVRYVVSEMKYVSTVLINSSALHAPTRILLV